MKYNAAGVKQWTRQIGTASYDNGQGVTTDSSGNIYVTGVTYIGLDGNISAGNLDIFLMKYDAAGVKQWTRQIGTIHDEQGHGVTTDISGNIYVTGETWGGLDGNTNSGIYDIFLIKYDAKKMFSGTPMSDDRGTSIINVKASDSYGGSASTTFQLKVNHPPVVANPIPDQVVQVGQAFYYSLADTFNSTDGLALNYTVTGLPQWLSLEAYNPGLRAWTRQIGTASYDYGRGVTTDSSGNIYVTGFTTGDLDGNINANAGNQDIFLTKYNAAGVKQWTRQIGTVRDDKGIGVTIDSSGNIYVTGETTGDLDGNTNASGYADIFLMKYNTAGVKQWTRQIGTTGTDRGYGVTTDSSGNIYVTGFAYGGLDGNTYVGLADIFLMKYNATGVKEWTRQIGTASSDIGNGVTTDSSGNIYVTGNTLGGLDGNTNAGGNDIFLMKYNATGVKQWTRQIGTASDDYGRGVTTDSSGNIYVTGETYGGLDENTNAGSWDIFLIKYNADGVKQWTRQIGSTSSDYGYGVTTDISGNIYVTGITGGSLDGNTNAGSDDIFLMKYDAVGVKQWTRQIGTVNNEQGDGVTMDISGNIYVTGETWGGLDGNTNAGNSDIFLMKYDAKKAFTGTPQTSDVGRSQIEIKVTDPQDDSTQTTFSLLVNRAPRLVKQLYNQLTDVGSIFSYALQGIFLDDDGDAFHYEVHRLNYTVLPELVIFR